MTTRRVKVGSHYYQIGDSTRLGWSESGRGVTHCREELHRLARGRFLLYGYGGPETRFRQPAGQDRWASGGVGEILSAEEAELWLARNGYEATAESIITEALAVSSGRPFGSGDGRTAGYHVRLTPEELATLKADAKAAGVSVSRWARSRLFRD